MDTRCSTIVLFTVQEVGKKVSQMRRKKKGMWKPKKKSCADRRGWWASVFHPYSICAGETVVRKQIAGRSFQFLKIVLHMID